MMPKRPKWAVILAALPLILFMAMVIVGAAIHIGVSIYQSPNPWGLLGLIVFTLWLVMGVLYLAATRDE